MVDYEIYNINGLPPLKIRRMQDRDALEKNPHVKSLIDTRLLLNKELNILLNNLINISDRILLFIKYLNKKPQDIFDELGRGGDKEERNYFSFIYLNFYILGSVHFFTLLQRRHLLL